MLTIEDAANSIRRVIGDCEPYQSTYENNRSLSDPELNHILLKFGWMPVVDLAGYTETTSKSGSIYAIREEADCICDYFGVPDLMPIGYNMARDFNTPKSNITREKLGSRGRESHIEYPTDSQYVKSWSKFMGVEYCHAAYRQTGMKGVHSTRIKGGGVRLQSLMDRVRYTYIRKINDNTLRVPKCYNGYRISPVFLENFNLEPATEQEILDIYGFLPEYGEEVVMTTNALTIESRGGYRVTGDYEDYLIVEAIKDEAENADILEEDEKEDDVDILFQEDKVVESKPVSKDDGYTIEDIRLSIRYPNNIPGNVVSGILKKRFREIAEEIESDFKSYYELVGIDGKNMKVSFIED